MTLSEPPEVPPRKTTLPDLTSGTPHVKQRKTTAAPGSPPVTHKLFNLPVEKRSGSLDSLDKEIFRLSLSEEVIDYLGCFCL